MGPQASWGPWLGQAQAAGVPLHLAEQAAAAATAVISREHAMAEAAHKTTGKMPSPNRTKQGAEKQSGLLGFLAGRLCTLAASYDIAEAGQGPSSKKST